MRAYVAQAGRSVVDGAPPLQVRASAVVDHRCNRLAFSPAPSLLKSAQPALDCAYTLRLSTYRCWCCMLHLCSTGLQQKLESVDKPLLLQVMNMIMPKVNVRRQAAWARDHEDQNMTPFDSQVGGGVMSHVACNRPHGMLLPASECLPARAASSGPAPVFRGLRVAAAALGPGTVDVLHVSSQDSVLGCSAACMSCCSAQRCTCRNGCL